MKGVVAELALVHDRVIVTGRSATTPFMRMSPAELR